MGKAIDVFMEIQKIGMGLGLDIQSNQKVVLYEDMLRMVKDHLDVSYEKAKLMLWGIEHGVHPSHFYEMDNATAYQIFKIKPKVSRLQWLSLFEGYNAKFLASINRALNHGLSFELLSSYGVFSFPAKKWEHAYFVVECIMNKYDFCTINYPILTKREVFNCIDLLKTRNPIVLDCLLNDDIRRCRIINKCLKAGIKPENIKDTLKVYSIDNYLLRQAGVVDYLNKYAYKGEAFFNLCRTLKNHNVFEFFELSKLAQLTHSSIEALWSLFEEIRIELLIPRIETIKELYSYDLSKIKEYCDSKTEANIYLLDSYELWKHTKNNYLSKMDFQEIIDNEGALLLGYLDEELLFFKNGNPIDIFKVLDYTKLHYINKVGFSGMSVSNLFYIISQSNDYRYLSSHYRIINRYEPYYWDLEFGLFSKAIEHDLLLVFHALNKIGELKPEYIDYLQKVGGNDPKVKRFQMIFNFAEVFKNADTLMVYHYLDQNLEHHDVLKLIRLNFKYDLDTLKRINLNQPFFAINQQIQEIEKELKKSIA